MPASFHLLKAVTHISVRGFTLPDRICSVPSSRRTRSIFRRPSERSAPPAQSAMEPDPPHSSFDARNASTSASGPATASSTITARSLSPFSCSTRASDWRCSRIVSAPGYRRLWSIYVLPEIGVKKDDRHAPNRFDSSPASQIQRRTLLAYRSYSTPNTACSRLSSTGMTTRFKYAMVSGKRIAGMIWWSMPASPTYAADRPRYIGFRVKR